jgi:lysostaphin
LASQAAPVDIACPAPALERIVKHRVSAGETLEQIAQRYNLIPATLMGLNPSVRDGKVTIGEDLLVPPFNGIRVTVPAGTSVREMASRYKVRPDVLFEINGCQPTAKALFIPGVNWSPAEATSPAPNSVPALVMVYPLSQKPKMVLGYGWKLNSEGKVALHSGVDLAAAVGTPVLAVADGTVAFAGTQGSYGQLVVLNHTQGYQTRYAQLGSLKVKVGQKVSKGQAIATVGNSGQPSSPEPHLHFEVRSNSKLGWVAADPQTFLR